MRANESSNPFAVVPVEFTLGRAQGPLSLNGTVARVSRDQQAGIKFFRLTAEQKEALKSYVDHHLGVGVAAH